MTAALAERPAKTRRATAKTAPKPASSPSPTGPAETPTETAVSNPTDAAVSASEDVPEQVEPATEPDPTTEPATAEPTESDPATPAPEQDQVEAEPTDDWDHAAIRSRREGLQLSRAQLATLSGLAGSRIWRAETPGGQPLEPAQRAAIIAALDKIDADGLPAEFAPKRGTKAPGLTHATLKSRLDATIAVLITAGNAKTVADLRKIVSAALHAAEGTTPQAPKTTEAADEKSEATDAS